MDLGHVALAAESKAKGLRLALDHLDRQLNDLINVFWPDLRGSISTGSVEHRQLGQLPAGFHDDGPRAVLAYGTTGTGLLRFRLRRNAGLVGFFLRMTGNTHQACQTDESKQTHSCEDGK